MLSRFSGKTTKHQMNHGNLNHRFAIFGQFFVVFAHAATAAEPRKCAFNDPSPWKYIESLLFVALDNLQGPLKKVRQPADQLAGVTAVSPDEM